MFSPRLENLSEFLDNIKKSDDVTKAYFCKFLTSASRNQEKRSEINSRSYKENKDYRKWQKEQDAARDAECAVKKVVEVVNTITPDPRARVESLPSIAEEKPRRSSFTNEAFRGEVSIITRRPSFTGASQTNLPKVLTSTKRN
jgi:hypothetical protein